MGHERFATQELIDNSMGLLSGTYEPSVDNPSALALTDDSDSVLNGERSKERLPPNVIGASQQRTSVYSVNSHPIDSRQHDCPTAMPPTEPQLL